MRSEISGYQTHGNLWVYPDEEIFSPPIEKVSELARQSRIVKNELNLEIGIILSKRSEVLQSELDHFYDLPENYTFPEIFGQVKKNVVTDDVTRSVSWLENGVIPAARNNWIFKIIRNSLKKGLLLLSIGKNFKDLQQIDLALEKLQKCKAKEFCLTDGKCSSKSNTSDGCTPKHSNFWRKNSEPSKFCCEPGIFTENALCGFNRTFSAFSYPSQYDIISDRFSTDESVILIDWKDEKFVALEDSRGPLAAEKIEKFLQFHLSTNTFQAEPKFSLSDCPSNSSYICLPELKNEKNGEVLDQILWDSQKRSKILLIISEPCGTCELASRAILELKHFLKSRLSTFLFSSQELKNTLWCPKKDFFYFSGHSYY